MNDDLVSKLRACAEISGQPMLTADEEDQIFELRWADGTDAAAVRRELGFNMVLRLVGGAIESQNIAGRAAEIAGVTAELCEFMRTAGADELAQFVAVCAPIPNE